MEEKTKDQEVLLVANKKESNKLSAVGGINEDGSIKTIPPLQKNESDFLKISKQDNALENFFTNFLRQYNSPTHFHFFKVPVAMIETAAEILQNMLKNEKVNKQFLDQYRVNPESVIKEQEQQPMNKESTQEKTETLVASMEQSQKHQRIDESRINWKQLENLGVTREMLEKYGNLNTMLNWQKSPGLIPISPKFDGISLRTDARLSFREMSDGNLSVVINAVRKEVNLDRPFYGIHFTNEDKQNLKATGNVGRLIEIVPKSGEKSLVFVSVDKLTNELIALRADKIRIPGEIKGVRLTEEQKQKLHQGKAVTVEGMEGKNGKIFSADVQVNANKRALEFQFKSQKLTQKELQSEQREVHINKHLLGVELTPEQQQQLRENHTVYVSGMKDPAGQLFNAYVRINHEKGKFDFLRWNPEKVQSKAKEVTPSPEHQTQVAVNAEGKTVEIVKNIQPNENQILNQEQKQTNRTNKGKKMGL
jgi:hypothetical protein